MKTLIVYEKSTGNISFTQSISGEGDVEYTTINADVPEDRVVARVEDGKIILEDTQEVKDAKEKLKKNSEDEAFATGTYIIDNLVQEKLKKKLC